jgi:anti-sigma regulatory factor (Ser/Thr protein kinase)
VVALTGPKLDTVDSADGVWVPVTDQGSVGAVRRVATATAAEVGLTEDRTADLAIIASELASNLVKHAVDGMALVRPVRLGQDAGVQIVSVDKGPGLADLAHSARDGHSTAGSLGIGLGAVARKATEVDGYSRPGMGTVVVVTVFPASIDPNTAGPSPAVRAGGVGRPMRGERVSGDGYAVRDADGRRQVMLCDGLGHGPLAQAAAIAAIASFRSAPAGGSARVVEHMHQRLRHTRGVVVLVVELDPVARVARFTGLGNIFGAVAVGGQRRVLVGQPGIAGHQLPRLRELDVPLPPAATVVLHSDGLTDRWRLDDYPGLLARTPVVIAATLLRDAGVRRDDAAVLVAQVDP